MVRLAEQPAEDLAWWKSFTVLERKGLPFAHAREDSSQCCSPPSETESYQQDSKDTSGKYKRHKTLDRDGGSAGWGERV